MKSPYIGVQAYWRSAVSIVKSGDPIEKLLFLYNEREVTNSMKYSARKSISLLLSLCMVLSLFSGVVLTSASSTPGILKTDVDPSHYTVESVYNVKTAQEITLNTTPSADPSLIETGSVFGNGADVLEFVISIEEGYQATAIYGLLSMDPAVGEEQSIPAVYQGGNLYSIQLPETVANESDPDGTATAPALQLVVKTAVLGTVSSYALTYDANVSGVYNSTSGAALSSGAAVSAGAPVKFAVADGYAPVVTMTDGGAASVLVEQTADGAYFFFMPEYAVSISASEIPAPAEYTVSWQADTGCTVNGVQDVTAAAALTMGDAVLPGNELAIDAEASAGYTITGVTAAKADDSAVTVQVTAGEDGKYYFTMPQYNVLLTVNAAAQDAGSALTYADGSNYDISDVMDSTASAAVASGGTVLSGHTVKFTVTPDAGYAITEVTATGAGAAVPVSRSEDGTYYFVMPDYAIELGAAAAQVVFDTATATTLSYYDFTEGGLFEGDVVYLTAKVAEAVGASPVSGGYVTFYYVTAAAEIPFANVEVLGGAAYTTTTLPANVTGFKAVYSGVKDLYATSTGTADAAVETGEIKWTSTNALSTEATFTVDTEYTLTLPSVSSESGTALTAGVDYLVDWQMYENGVWVNLEENTDKTTYTIKADAVGIKYRAHVVAAGAYTLPAAGLLSAEISVTEKLAPVYTLSVEGDTEGQIYEGDLIHVVFEGSGTAHALPTGTVWFTMPDGTKVSAALVNGKAEAQWTVPSSFVNVGTAKTGQFYVEYSGDAIYNPVSKTAGGTQYSFKTKTLSGVSAGITAYNTSTQGVDKVLTALTFYNLSLSGVKDAQGNTLTEDQDYTVTWYSGVGNGTYARMDSPNSVKPANTHSSYKAVVEPAGNYEFGAFEVLIGCDNEIATSLTLSHVDYTAEGTYEGQPLTIRALVQDQTGNVVHSGVVDFYASYGSVWTHLGSSNVSNGFAQIQYNALPVGTTQISALYSGVEGIYKRGVGETAEVEILSASLSADTWSVSDANSDALIIVGNTETLSVVATDAAANYVYGTDYYIVWQISKDSGLTWTDTEAAETIQAAPMDLGWQYRALIYPMGNYTTTEDGAYIVAGKVTAGKADTTTSLDISNEDGSTDVFEGHDRILLTAKVENADLDVTVGTVSFYVSSTQYASISEVTANATKLGEAALNTNGGASVNVPAPAYGTYYYYAVYSSGVSGSFSDSFAEASQYVYSTTIAFADANPVIVADPADLAVGGTYTLTAPDVVSVDGQTLAVDVDYYYIWYYSPDGSMWYMAAPAGPSNVCEGTFDTDSAIYRAVAYPMGDYKLPENGISVSISGAQAIVTSTSLTVSGYFDDTNTSTYGYVFPNGTDIILTAKVIDANGNPASGVVRFYKDGTEIGSAQFLDAAGMASITIKAELGLAGIDTASYSAAFQENEVYAESESAGKVVSIVPNEIALEQDDIIYTANAAGGLTVGQSCTLTAPDVTILGLPAVTEQIQNFKLDNAYYYVWQVSYDAGTSWTNLSQSGKSITVTPETIDYAYRVIAMPISTTGFVNPYSGDVSNVVYTLTKAVSNVELEVQGLSRAEDGTYYAYEGETITLTAKIPEVKGHNLDNQGNVTFYYSVDGGVTKTLIPYPATIDVDAAGEATVNFVMPAYEKDAAEIIFYAVYSGSKHFEGSEDSTQDSTITIRSTAIAWDDDGAGNPANGITIYNGIGTSGSIHTGAMKAGNTYTLSLPDVYAQDDLETPLTAGLDYCVQWFYSIDQGGSWDLAAWVGDDQTILTVEDEQVNYSYKAYVYPYDVTRDTVLSHYNKAVVYPNNTDPVTYANYLTAELSVRTQRSDTQTVLAITDVYAVEADGVLDIAGEHDTEFEGDTVTLTATVTETVSGAGNPVSSGYVAFYQNGVEIARVDYDPTNPGVYTWEAQMSAYDDASAASANLDVFTAKYFENEYFAASESEAKNVYIRSASIDTPVISATVNGDTANTRYTWTGTAHADITGLSAGVPITFALIDGLADYPSVLATDGREVPDGSYTIYWQKLTGTDSYTDATLTSGSVYSDTYSIEFGNNGDTYRVYLEARDLMDEGAASEDAIVGEKLTPTVVLTPEFTYDPTLDTTYTGVDTTKGSHFGDEISLKATVKGTVAAPTGWVEFFYTAMTDPTDPVTWVSLGSVELSENGVANEAVAVLDTMQLPVDKLQLKAVYKGYDSNSDETFEGDDVYVPAGSGITVYKVWSVSISDAGFTELKNVETGYGLVSISATDKDGSPVAAGTSLIANDTYTLTLGDVYTKSGELLSAGEYTVEWYVSQDYVPGTSVNVEDAAAKWTHLSALDDLSTVTVTPQSQNTMYIARVTTTTALYNKDYPSTSLEDTEYSNIIGASLQDVTVTVTTSADHIYQANDLTIFAEVKPGIAGDVSGYVEFYYTFVNESGDYTDAVWYPVVSKDAEGGNTAALTARTAATDTDATMIAQITTNTLYVEADGTASRLIFKAVYLGNATYSGADNTVIATDPAAITVNSPAVDVYSSIIYVDEATENQYVTRETGAKGIVIEPASALVSDGTVTYLTLNPIYTLDAYDAAGTMGIMAAPPAFAELKIGEDYTIIWQQRPIDAADLDTWETVAVSDDSMQSNIIPQEGYAYRAAIVTLAESEKVRAANLGWNDVDNGIEGIEDAWITNGTASGIYYSNIITVNHANAYIGLNAVPASSVAIDGDEVSFEIFVAGGETTPNGKVSLTVTNEDGTVVFADDANLASGMVTIPWTEADGTTMVKVPAGEYTVTVSAVLNNGYVADPVIETYIVRYTDHTMAGTDQRETYDADRQLYDLDNITFAFDNFYGIDETDLEALAAQMVVISYYDEAGEKVEAPVDAGVYTVKAYLPESIYWTEIEETTIAVLTVDKRAISVVDIIAQHKVYDGSTNADILVVTLEDAATDQVDTGLPTGNTGLIDGDSVYAVGSARTSTANAGACTITFITTALAGPDAQNYKLPAAYTEDFTIYRNQLEGQFQSGVVIPFKAFDETQIADYFTVIEEGGATFTDYELIWYYHDAGSITMVEDPSALLVSESLVENDTYVFTVVVRPISTENYKGGVSGTITVDRNAVAATVPALDAFDSTIIHISNTYEIFGNEENTGVVVDLTNENATAQIQYYVDGSWTDALPTAAGRYAVLVTASTGDTEVGIYTVMKAQGVYKLPYVENKLFDGEAVTYSAVGDGMDWPDGSYATWSGGRIQGFCYEAPSDAGTYLVTVHIPETENYVATTVSYSFTISRRTVNITICDIYNNLFAVNPKMYVNYELASGGDTGLVDGDSSLRDVLIDPTLILTRINDTATGDSLNDIGEYNIDALGASAYNYVFTYSQGALTMNATNPQEALTILGAPDGVIRYGDTFTLFGYGNKGALIGGSGMNMNNSSEISWSILEGNEVAEIDQDGNVRIIGVGSFTVRYTRGTGAYQIYVDKTYTAEKKEAVMLITDDDFVYDQDAHVIADGNFSFEGLVGTDTLTVAGNTITQSPASVLNALTRTDWDAGYVDVGEYVVNGEFETDLYYGTGAGLLTINRREAEVAPDTDAVGLDGEMTYGEDPDSALTLGYAEFGAIDPDVLLTGGIAVTAVDADDDVGEYEILVGSGALDNNYNVAFITEGYQTTSNDVDVVTVIAKRDLTIASGWAPYTFAEGDADAIAYEPVERMYGEPMPNANTDIDGLISADSAADLELTDAYVLTKDAAGNVYAVPVRANKDFNDSSDAPGAGSAKAYGEAADQYILDIADVENINSSYKNYLADAENAAALTDLVYHVYQRPITLAAKNAAVTNLEVIHGEAYATVYAQLLDLLTAEKWQGIGGLAEAYGETIDDLGVYFEIYNAQGQLVATIYEDRIDGSTDFLIPGSTTTYRVVPKISNSNYKLMDADELTLTVTLTKVLAIVTPGKYNGITGFTVTTYVCTYNPATDTWTQTQAFLDSALEYEIFVRTADNDYTDEIPVRSGTMRKTSTAGVYSCSYSRLDNGGYEIFLSAQGYNIVRTM